MGLGESRLHGSLPEECRKYAKLVVYVNKNQDLHSDTKVLRKAIYNYLTSFEKHQKSGNDDLTFYGEISDEAWIMCVHKLHPVKYQQRGNHDVDFKSDTEWFVKAAIRQADFCKKIYPLLPVNNFYHWISSYKNFTKLIRKNPGKILVPSLEEDFVWHAHMQNHRYYAEYFREKMGRILDHDDDIEPELLRKYTLRTSYIKQGFNYKEKEQTTTSTTSTTSSVCVTLIAMPIIMSSCGVSTSNCTTMSTCGVGSTCGSTCGSSCGSGCGGGCGGS